MAAATMPALDLHMHHDDLDTLASLESRLRTILPEEYQDSYEDLQPLPMRAAGLKFGADGKVAWNEIWGSFCNLAMAGGPPHKGALLEPGDAGELAMHPSRCDEVVQEICRGITMATGLPARPAPTSGWVRVVCLTEGMAGWLHRAIAMENVAVRRESRGLDLPAGPAYRLEREIKNVVTVIAKTSHYWLGHIPKPQQRIIAELFTRMAVTMPLLEPESSGSTARTERQQRVADRVAEASLARTGLGASSHRYVGWLGLECSSVRSAVWTMRALVASNVLSRREDAVLFVPLSEARDPHGEIVAGAIERAQRFARLKGVA